MATPVPPVETAPQLGLATTRELYRELIARALVDAATEGDDAEHDPVVLNLRELLAGVEAQGKASYRTAGTALRITYELGAALGEEGAPRSGRIIPCTASAAETEWKLERSGRGDSDPASAGERLDELRTGNAPERSGRSIGSRSLLASASRDSGSEANGEENTRG